MNLPRPDPARARSVWVHPCASRRQAPSQRPLAWHTYSGHEPGAPPRRRRCRMRHWRRQANHGHQDARSGAPLRVLICSCHSSNFISVPGPHTAATTASTSTAASTTTTATITASTTATAPPPSAPPRFRRGRTLLNPRGPFRDARPARRDWRRPAPACAIPAEARLRPPPRRRRHWRVPAPWDGLRHCLRPAIDRAVRHAWRSLRRALRRPRHRVAVARPGTAVRSRRGPCGVVAAAVILARLNAGIVGRPVAVAGGVVAIGDATAVIHVVVPVAVVRDPVAIPRPVHPDIVVVDIDVDVVAAPVRLRPLIIAADAPGPAPVGRIETPVRRSQSVTPDRRRIPVPRQYAAPTTGHR